MGLMLLTTGKEENPGHTSSFGCPKRLNICERISDRAVHLSESWLAHLVDLINLSTTCKEGFFLHQLGKDTAYRPDVDTGGVLFDTEQQFG